MASHYAVESTSHEPVLLSDPRVTFHDKHETRLVDLPLKSASSCLGTQDSLDITGIYQMTGNLNGTRRGPGAAALST